MSHVIGAKLIVALTRSGKSARMIARYKPAENILVLSDVDTHIRTMMLSYGCFPSIAPTFKTIDEIMEIVRSIALKTNLVKKGDKVVIVAGMPFGTGADTNFTLVETV